MFVPILSYYAIQNKTFDVAYKESGWFYSLDIKSVYIKKIGDMKKKTLEFTKENKVRMTITNIDVDLSIDGSIYAIWFIPMSMSSCSLKNVTIVMDIEVDDNDKVDWQTTVTPKFDIADVQFHMKSSFLNWCLSFLHDKIMEMAKLNLPAIGKLLTDQVTQYDLLMKTENSKTFLTDVLNTTDYLMNLTTPTAPVLSQKTGLFSFNLDGTFVNMKTMQTNAAPNTEYIPRIPNAQKEQIFIHESAINSALYALKSKFLPMSVTNQTFTSELFILFHELVVKYTMKSKLNITIDAILPKADPLKLTKKSGISTQDLKILFSCYALKDGAKAQELAFTFQMDIQANLNMSV